MGNALTRSLQGLRTFGLVAVALTGMASQAASYSEQDAHAFIDKMSHSFRELNYQGSFSYQRGESMESLRILHAVIDGAEFEYLEYMDGEKRDIVRRGHSLNCVHPGHQLVRFPPAFQRQSTSVTGEESTREDQVYQRGLEEYYQFSVTGKGRIAGRPVVNLQVSPRDTHRFGYRLSLDQETGLLLRSELLGAEGKILERFQFVDITIGQEIAEERFDVDAKTYHAEHVAPAVEPGQFGSKQAWLVNWLPGGFTAAQANRRYGAGDMATFTDGLTVFSVFLEQDPDPQALAEGHAQRGATIAYSRALILAGRPHRVTVVGEIPQRTAQQIAQSVAFAK